MQKKKLLGSTLALALVFAYWPANAAELLKNFKVGGQIDLQATSARNVTDFRTVTNDRIDDVQTRVLLNADWDVLDDVHAKVSLRKNDRTWGTAGGTAINNGQGATSNSQAVDAAGVLGNVFLDQAYFKVDKALGSVDATFGRQFYGASGDIIGYFGPSDKAEYGLPVNAIDAARLDWSNDMLGVTGLAGRTNSTAVGVLPAAGVANAQDVRTINAACKGHDAMSVSGYAWNRVTHANSSLGNVGGFNDNLWIVGAKGKAMLGDMAWIGGEVAKDFGEMRTVLGTGAPGVTGAGAGGPFPSANYRGWAFKLDAGAKADLAGMGALAPWLHFAMGSGDNGTGTNQNNNFVAVAPDYRPGSIYGRFATATTAAGTSLGSALGSAGTNPIASNALSNRTIWGLGVKATPGMLPKLTAGISYWDFRFQKSPRNTTTGAVVGGGNSHIGSEGDVDLEWKHSENISFNGGWGRFWRGGFIQNAANAAGNGLTSPATLVYFDTRVKF